MNKLLSFLLACGSLFLLTGCWDRTEINDVAFVLGVGIDKGPDNTIEVAVQIAAPKAMGENAGGDAQTLVRSAHGITLFDAVSKLQEKIPRKIFWGHSEAIVFGERLAKEGIRTHLDFFIRHPQPRLRSHVFVSKANAKDVLALLPPLEPNSSEALRELASSKLLLSVTLDDLLHMMKGDGKAAALPMIDLLQPSKGQDELQTIAYIHRTAVFKKDRMIGELDDHLTRGVLWIRDEVEESTVTVKPEGADGYFSGGLLRANTELIPEIKNGKWMIKLMVVTEDDILSNGSTWNPMEPQIARRIEEEIEKSIEERIHLSLQKVQKEMNADILGFADVFHHQFPKEWKKVKDHWEDVFPSVEVTTEVDVHIRRAGKATRPQGLPEEEVKDE